MPEWCWLQAQEVLAIHDAQMAEHGGGTGLRDGGLLESALARPQNLAAYDEPDVGDLAAAYLLALAKNHAFVDGNKRTAWTVAETFIELNGHTITASDEEAFNLVLRVAEGGIDEAAIANWFRSHLGVSSAP